MRKIKFTQGFKVELEERGWITWCQGFVFKTVNPPFEISLLPNLLSWLGSSWAAFLFLQLTPHLFSGLFS